MFFFYVPLLAIHLGLRGRAAFQLTTLYLGLAVSSAPTSVCFPTFVIALQSIDREASCVKRFWNDKDS